MRTSPRVMGRQHERANVGDTASRALHCRTESLMGLNMRSTALKMLWGGDAFMECVAMLPDEAFELVDSESSWLDCAWGLGCLRTSCGFPWGRAFDSLVSLSGGVSVVDREDKDPVPETSDTEPASGVSRLRLRPRGAYTKSIEAEVLRSTWWSDLGRGALNPAKAWLDSYFGGSGAKTTGLVKELSWVDGDRTRSLWLTAVRFCSENGSSDLWVSHELLASLVTVRMFRPITEGLLASLRSAARLWAEDIGMPKLDLVRLMPGTLVLSCLPMPDEVVAAGALHGVAAAWSSDVLGALGKGVARGPSSVLSSWWAVLKPSLGGETKKSPTSAHCAVRMPT